MKQLIKQWLFYVRHMYAHKPTTVKIYTRFGNLFIKRWGNLASISAEDIETFIIDEKSIGLSNSTINQKLAVLRVFFSWAISHKKMIDRPTVKLLRVPKIKVIKSLSDQEIVRLLDIAKYSPVEYGILIGIMAGLRREEIRFLEWKDVNLDNKLIHIRAKEGFSPKGYSERSIPIPDALVARLVRRRKSTWVINYDQHQVSTSYLERKLKDVFDEAGIHEVGMPTWHRLRHTFASKFIEAGGDIQSLKDIMGHGSIQTTQTYMHSNPIRQRAIVESMNII